MPGRSAFDRVFRTLVVSVGVGAIVFTLLGVPGILDQYSSLNPAYTITVVTIFCGLPPAMALIAFRSNATMLRALAILHSVASFIFLLLWLPNMTASTLPGGAIPWLINMITLATCMAAISFPVIWAWVFLCSTAAVGGFVRFVAYGGGDSSTAFQDSIMIVLISGFMMALLQLTLRAGKEQDIAAQIARDAAMATAAAENLERQRTRYHAFTHDDVLATLLAASQDGAIPSEITKRSAQRTLEKLDQFRNDEIAAPALTMTELDASIRQSAAALDLPVVSNLASATFAELTIPTEVADALTEASTEAMRNSVRHAAWPDGRAVSRSVNAERTDSSVSVTVSDDGFGFNPRRVGIDRLGVRLSILQRMNSQPGGDATIISARGAGTTVQLTWTAGGENEG